MKESKELIEVLDYFIEGTKNVIAGCDENDPSLPEEYKRLRKLLRGKKWVLSIVVGQSEQLCDCMGECKSLDVTIDGCRWLGSKK